MNNHVVIVQTMNKKTNKNMAELWVWLKHSTPLGDLWVTVYQEHNKLWVYVCVYASSKFTLNQP